MKKTVAIIGGGYSSEAEISIKSAFNLKDMLGNELFSIHVVFISKDTWVVKDDNGDIPINRSDFSFASHSGKLIKFDCAYITIHGTPGEDGKLQSYFEMIKLPYTTCDVFTSSLTFNKFATKVFLKEYGIRSAEAVLIRKGDSIDESAIINKVKLPCFVKPNNGGSSFGVTKVSDVQKLREAISEALKEDSEVIIEAFLDGLEFTNGAYKVANTISVLPITEIVTDNEFFDYKAKYTGQSEEITPANIPEALTCECQQLTETIYRILNCKGIVRVDYILSEGDFYLLEINTVPGLSKESIIPQQIRAAKLREKDVFNAIITDAINTIS